MKKTYWKIIVKDQLDEREVVIYCKMIGSGIFKVKVCEGDSLIYYRNNATYNDLLKIVSFYKREISILL